MSPIFWTVCSLMADYEVTLVNDNMQEFFVRFHGPTESECDCKQNLHFVLQGKTAIKARAAKSGLVPIEEAARNGMNMTATQLPHFADSKCVISLCVFPAAPFAGGVWKIHVELPADYPYKSPSIGFMNKIFHPNIDEVSGSVCLDVINQTWSPMYELKNIFETFLPQLLGYPNAADPLNGEAASLYMRDVKSYELRVKEYVSRYATKEALHENGDGGETESEESEDDDEENYSAGEEDAADMEL